MTLALTFEAHGSLGEGEHSLFKGINYVFDSRIGTVVTETLPVPLSVGEVAVEKLGETHVFGPDR